MKILTKKLCSFMLLLALVVTVIPQPTKVSAYVNGAPRTVYMRIGEVCDLNKLVGKDFYVEEAKYVGDAIESAGDNYKKFRAVVAGRTALRYTWSYKHETQEKAMLNVIILPKDTSKVKFSRDGYVLVKDVKIDDGYYRRATYTISFYNRSKLVAKKHISVRFSGITDSWVRTKYPTDLDFTKVKVSAKYSPKRPLHGNDGFDDKLTVSSGYYDSDALAFVLNINYKKNHTTSNMPKVYYTVWAENSKGDVLATAYSEFTVKKNQTSGTLKRAVRISNKMPYEKVNVYASVGFLRLVRTN